jgi:toxin ParE1/3/4
VIIVWSPEATDDLLSLRAYIADSNPDAAQRVALNVVEAVEQLLSDHPDLGRPGRVPGTRELVVAGTAYIVPYRIQANRVHVLRVYHGARRWPERF